MHSVMRVRMVMALVFISDQIIRTATSVFPSYYENRTVKAAFNPSTRITGSRVSCPSRLRPSRNESQEYSEDLLG